MDDESVEGKAVVTGGETVEDVVRLVVSLAMLTAPSGVTAGFAVSAVVEESVEVVYMETARVTPLVSTAIWRTTETVCITSVIPAPAATAAALDSSAWPSCPSCPSCRRWTCL
jgi:hypothetical protein